MRYNENARLNFYLFVYMAIMRILDFCKSVVALRAGTN